MQAALSWCLEVQDLAMYQPWPLSVLSCPGFQLEADPATGALLFCGPRLKMGVCKGRPRSIEPEINARASYHGRCVRMAACYCDAAAQGGQVVTDAALAVRIAHAWRREESARSDAALAARNLRELLASSRVKPASPDAGLREWSFPPVRLRASPSTADGSQHFRQMSGATQRSTGSTFDRSQHGRQVSGVLQRAAGSTPDRSQHGRQVSGLLQPTTVPAPDSSQHDRQDSFPASRSSGQNTAPAQHASASAGIGSVRSASSGSSAAGAAVAVGGAAIPVATRPLDRAPASAAAVSGLHNCQPPALEASPCGFDPPAALPEESAQEPDAATALPHIGSPAPSRFEAPVATAEGVQSAPAGVQSAPTVLVSRLGLYEFSGEKEPVAMVQILQEGLMARRCVNMSVLLVLFVLAMHGILVS